MRIGLAPEAEWRSGIERLRELGADLICLPQLSFVPYMAASRDRAGLELAERAPSKLLTEAVAAARGAWLAASAYESEGEGVFYVTSYLAGPEGERAAYRQRRVEAGPGRYEQMFWSPGYRPNQVVRLPIGLATTLVGADLRDPNAWADVAAVGVRVVVGGACEPSELWSRTTQVVAGMAASHRMLAIAVNRSDKGDGAKSPEDAIGFDRDGRALQSDEMIYEVAS